MAKQKRKTKRTKLRYFFLNGELHKSLRISRGEDLIIAWNYPQKKKCSYVWSVTQKNMGRAFTIIQAANILQRKRLVIHRYIAEGKIKRPAIAYPLSENPERPGKYLLSEDDMRDLHSFLLTVHRGRPRADGQINPGNLISRAELEAIMREDRVLYAKTEDGEFMPVWKQPDW